MSDPPVLLFAYANDRADDKRYLRNLPEERRRIRQALERLRDTRRCEIIECPNATVDELLNESQRAADRLAVFHFAGHADGKTLLFEDAEGNAHAAGASSLAEFLAGLPRLRLVVLNGCSTREQVEEILRRGVPSVVATSADVRDDVATEFAARFYAGLAIGSTLRDAFEQASGAIKLKFGVDDTQRGTLRGVMRDVGEQDPPAARDPWEIHGSAQTLDAPIFGPPNTWRVVGLAAAITAAACALGGGAYAIATAGETPPETTTSAAPPPTTTIPITEPKPPPTRPTSIPRPTCPPLANKPFVRAQPQNSPTDSPDACNYLGFLPDACVRAYFKEKDAGASAWMLRVSDAWAHRARKQLMPYEPPDYHGPKQCNTKGTCLKEDQGIMCLAVAEDLAAQNKDRAASEALRFGCGCDGARAAVPLLGGTLACIGKDPVDRSAKLQVDEAKDLKACAPCGKDGLAACQRAYKRMCDANEYELARYLREVHVPRCQRK